MQNPETCREIVRQLWPCLDGALPDEWQERVSAHLVECDACRSHYDFERAFLVAVRASGAYRGDIGALYSRVLTALGAEGGCVHG